MKSIRSRNIFLTADYSRSGIAISPSSATRYLSFKRKPKVTYNCLLVMWILAGSFDHVSGVYRVVFLLVKHVYYQTHTGGTRSGAVVTSYCLAILTRYVSCVYCRGGIAILSLEKGGKNDPFLSLFWEEKIAEREGIRKDRKRDDREKTWEENQDWKIERR